MPDHGDELYPADEHIVRASGNTAISFLQRRLIIGYNRAAVLMDELEARGIVSAFVPGAGRTIIKTSQEQNPA